MHEPHCPCCSFCGGQSVVWPEVTISLFLFYHLTVADHRVINMFIFKPVLKEDELKDVPFEREKAKHGGTAWGFLFS